MASKGYHHMTQHQRCQLQIFLSMKKPRKEIAQELGLSESSLSREIFRNSIGYGYNFQEAHRKASERRSAASKVPRKMKGELKALIINRLEEDWSPEQISGRLKLYGKQVSHETIYRFVRQDKAGGGLLYEHLRHHGKRYRSKKSRQSGVHCIPNRVDIAERPAIVAQKLRIGDWEGDTIISHGSHCALVTLVDRKSKYVLMKKIG
ncbi:MAG: IS30 family transposase, partial [Holosporaceae bacterium]|nr:IS30 family transposase [Holosporaceae bacterium]